MHAHLPAGGVRLQRLLRRRHHHHHLLRATQAQEVATTATLPLRQAGQELPGGPGGAGKQQQERPAGHAGAKSAGGSRCFECVTIEPRFFFNLFQAFVVVDKFSKSRSKGTAAAPAQEQRQQQVHPTTGTGSTAWKTSPSAPYSSRYSQLWIYSTGRLTVELTVVESTGGRKIQKVFH